MGEKLNDGKIIEFSRADLLSKSSLTALYSTTKQSEKERLKALMTIRAKELDMEKEFVGLIKAYDKAEKALAAEKTRDYARQNKGLNLKISEKGVPLSTIENFLTVLRADDYFNGLKFNQLTYSPEQERNGKVSRWTDADDSRARAKIETDYGIHHSFKLDDALRIVFSENEYHPIKNLIDFIVWDGVERIADFLPKWAKCEDNEYTREVSRLIFAGGINRLYSPGCKFDDVPVLIGTKQGEGKSTLVKWLALRDDFFAEVTTIDGQQGMEAVEGAWICEISELLALTRAKEVEAAKSYLSRVSDRYRRPFDRRVTEHLRQCIFVGTTNKMQFLKDKTGNRRFYPVLVNQVGYELFNAKTDALAYISQCWAEAKYKYDKGIMLPFASIDLKVYIEEHQQESVEDDYREGMILEYLEVNNIIEICIMELWEKALHNEYVRPSRSDSMDISLILQSLDGWERKGSVSRTKDYGIQRVWVRAATQINILEGHDFTGEKLPF